MKLVIILSSIFLGSGISSPTHLPVSNPFSQIQVSKNHERKVSGSPEGTVYIIIVKSDYELQVYDDKGWYATYPVVFGNSSLDDKKMEGDRNTPEGTFKVISKKYHNKWDRFIMLDYPTKESYEKFNQRKSRGEIPRGATIGGGVGIHWPELDEDISVEGLLAGRRSGEAPQSLKRWLSLRVSARAGRPTKAMTRRPRR